MGQRRGDRLRRLVKCTVHLAICLVIKHDPQRFRPQAGQVRMNQRRSRNAEADEVWESLVSNSGNGIGHITFSAFLADQVHGGGRV